MANRMSLFYANPTPMLNTLSGAAEKLQTTNWAGVSVIVHNGRHHSVHIAEI